MGIVLLVYDYGRKVVKLVKMLWGALLEALSQVLALLAFVIMSGEAIILFSIIGALILAWRVKDLASQIAGREG